VYLHYTEWVRVQTHQDDRSLIPRDIPGGVAREEPQGLTELDLGHERWLERRCASVTLVAATPRLHG
jgi:hypothetical protein